MKNTVTCIKEITTKNGLTFVEGKKYEFTIIENTNRSFRINIYKDKFNFATTKNERIFKKYFI